MNITHYLNKILFKANMINNSPLRKGNNCNFIFIHINKTGGTSVSKAIGLPKKQHLTAKQIIDQIGQDKWDAAYKFTFVRNPWDKVVSHYKYRIKTNQTLMGEDKVSFYEWVKLTYGEEKDPFYYDNPKMFQPQVEWIKNKEEKIDVEFIGKLESINSDFKEIKNIIGIEHNLPHLNKTKKVDYRKFYDNETKEIIRSWFQEDIETFKYKFS